jgi:hypothetical protein
MLRRRDMLQQPRTGARGCAVTARAFSCPTVGAAAALGNGISILVQNNENPAAASSETMKSRG